MCNETALVKACIFVKSDYQEDKQVGRSYYCSITSKNFLRNIIPGQLTKCVTHMSMAIVPTTPQM